MNSTPQTEDLSHLGGSDGGAGTFVPDIFERIVTQYDLCSVIDVGCAEGRNARWFKDRGLYVLGVDGFPSYIENNKIPRDHLVLHDYTKGPFVPDMAFDLGWSSEFVEHVEEQFIPNFLATFARCKHVCLTFATPGQGGHHHVTERDEPFWEAHLASAGFVLDRVETERMRDTGRNTSYGRRTLTWFTAKTSPIPAAREEARYEYPLTRASVVLDAGGYYGLFCRPLAEQYGCRIEVFEPVSRFRKDLAALITPATRDCIHIHDYGLSNETKRDKFVIQGDSTGLYANSGREVQEVQLRDIRQVFDELNLTQVDLMKLNIEGSEFAVLQAMLDANLMERVRFLQVQWHDCFPHAHDWRRLLKGRLLKTHLPQWEAPWIWEAFERK